MNVLITTIFEYPHEGGLSTHVSTLKRGLEERGHQVDVLSFTSFNPVLRRLTAQAPGFILNKVKKGKGQFLNDYMRKKLLSRYLRSKINKCRYDVINSQDVYAALASIDTGIPTVATVHGYFSFEAISRGSIHKNSPEDLKVQEIERAAYQNAAAVVSVDNRIKDYIKAKAGINANIIKNFIDISNFEPSKVDTTNVKKEFHIPEVGGILFVPRRMTEKNGVIFPTLALPKILEKYPETILVYAGTGEQMGRIKEEIEKRNLHSHVKLLGSVPHHKMKELYAIADVVLVPSIHSYGVEEATSISALEAMGSESPVVAGAVGGLKEIFLDHVDGLLVEVQNVDELAHSVIKILDQPEFGRRLAKKAREKVEREYSHLAAAQKFEEIYQSVIE